MYGILLMLGSTFFHEISESIGKEKVLKHEESVYTMGFLALLWSSIFFIIISIIKPDSFVFSFASLPTFIPRLLLEFVQTHIGLIAIVKAERSTFGFLRILTLPLLLMTDLIMGYSISNYQIAGVMVIIVSLVFLFINHGISKKGVGFVLYTAFGAVATLSLYKYNITHYNSVVAEQLIVILCLLVYFSILSIYKKHEHPILALKKPIFLIQSISAGLGSILASFAYMFAPASIITGIKRSSNVLWSIISGKKHFHEKYVVVKLISFIILCAGIVLLSIK